MSAGGLVALYRSYGTGRPPATPVRHGGPGAAGQRAPLAANRARPSRTKIEVASLPVAGWLVGVEVEAAIR